jgi:hypothetical protein
MSSHFGKRISSVYDTAPLFHKFPEKLPYSKDIDIILEVFELFCAKLYIWIKKKKATHDTSKRRDRLVGSLLKRLAHLTDSLS